LGTEQKTFNGHFRPELNASVIFIGKLFRSKREIFRQKVKSSMDFVKYKGIARSNM
jgi:hypothetical protein